MKSRITSIDIFRALTMLLMIFVNDLWTLKDIPGWLEHTKAHEDGMGLADVVFPAFLFIVGLSIPFALRARLNKGESRIQVFFHIIRRSIALIIMGFFMVNQESLSSEMPQLTKHLWQVFMILAFILIWNDYGGKSFFGLPVWVLQFTGILILVILALVFKGGSADNPQWMSPQWWGILGLIGWAYLICATLYLFVIQNVWIVPLLWLMAFLLNVLEFVPSTKDFCSNLLIVSAANHALIMSGILATQLYLLVRDGKQKNLFPVMLLMPALLMFILGIAVRPLWGISKIMGTPSWSALCSGISYVAFALIYLIADVLKFTRWSAPIMPAGTNTLTCYLLPGLVYPVLWPLQQLLPPQVLTGNIGLLKSLAFSLFIILLTWLAEKVKIKLRI